jgi:hypothetical protein
MESIKPPYCCRVHMMDESIHVWPNVKGIKPFMAFLEDYHEWWSIEVYSKDGATLLRIIPLLGTEIGFGFGDWLYSKKWFKESYQEKASDARF